VTSPICLQGQKWRHVVYWNKYCRNYV